MIPVHGEVPRAVSVRRISSRGTTGARYRERNRCNARARELNGDTLVIGIGVIALCRSISSADGEYGSVLERYGGKVSAGLVQTSS